MNIKLKRTVRTPHSEEIDIIDSDLRDENEQPISIGKLEVHYLDDQIVGTLLIWEEFAQGYNRTQGTNVIMDDLIETILSEVTEPIGVPAEYGIEIYFPSVINHSYASHYAEDDIDASSMDGDEETANPDQAYEDEAGDGQETEGEEEQPHDDDFYRKLRQRP